MLSPLSKIDRRKHCHVQNLMYFISQIKSLINSGYDKFTLHYFFEKVIKVIFWI